MARKPTLLCVDDDVQCLAVRKIMLEAFGFKVTTTPDPRQALRMHAAQPYDAAILDFQMPHMDGGELAKAMKVSRPGVPVLILSGMPYLPEGTPHYYDRFFCKTESSIKLAQEIQQLIAAADSGDDDGNVGVTRRVIATAGILLGFATQGLSEVRHRLFHGPAMAKGVTPASA
jgi:DNA-binding NtrC family response regulator